MGLGDKVYEDYFRYLINKYLNKVGNYIGFNEKIVYIIYVVSDMFMMFLRFELCGLG